VGQAILPAAGFKPAAAERWLQPCRAPYHDTNTSEIPFTAAARTRRHLAAENERLGG